MVSKSAVMVREVKSMVITVMAMRVRVKQMLRGIETSSRWLMDGVAFSLCQMISHGLSELKKTKKDSKEQSMPYWHGSAVIPTCERQ